MTWLWGKTDISAQIFPLNHLIFVYHSVARHFPILHTYHRISMSEKNFHHAIGSSEDLEMISRYSPEILFLLESLCGSGDLKHQLLFLRDMDKISRKTLRGTLFANNILIVWAHIAKRQQRDVKSFEAESAIILSYYLQ